MKIKPSFMKYLFLFLGLGITNKTFSPDIKSYARHTLYELNEIISNREKEEKKQFIIKELKKPVLDFYSPVDTGQISCVYGYRKDKKEFHKGIDIGILGNASLKFAQRPNILAAASGIVDFAGNETGYGKVVKIKHNDNIETIYAHLNDFFVKNGDTVLAQQKIGEMGRNGNARSDKKGSKIHLHFEARKNNKPFNPNEYFKDYKKISIDDTLYSNVSENNFVSYVKKLDRKSPLLEIKTSANQKTHCFFDLSVENVKQLENKILPSLENALLNAKSFYEIQITASLNKLSKEKIKNLEKIYECSVKENKINGMYKYSIKQFSSLEEALGFKNSLHSKDNLGIMVYKNNKIVETKWD